jgi:TatD DNase family protein
MYFDSHAHYDDRDFNPDRTAVLTSLPKKGISLIVNPGCSMQSSRDSITLAERFPFVYAAVGVHPHDAKGMRPGDIDELERLSAHKKVVAIGEIGLDYHYYHSPREVQRERFREQLELARKTGLPAIVHDREAHEDCLKIVKEYRDVRGVYHCYSGSLEDAKILIGLGWYLSFTGSITYKNARRSHEVIQWMPPDRLMIETDSPYLTPLPFRGERNDSGYLPLVAETIAELRAMTVSEVARLTEKNGKTFFKIS